MVINLKSWEFFCVVIMVGYVLVDWCCSFYLCYFEWVIYYLIFELNLYNVYIMLGLVVLGCLLVCCKN